MELFPNSLDQMAFRIICVLLVLGDLVVHNVLFAPQVIKSGIGLW